MFSFSKCVIPPGDKKRETRKKEGKFFKRTKKVYSAPGAGCPLLMSFHKHFVHLSGWWGGWTAYWTAAWSLGQFPNKTSNSANMNCFPILSTPFISSWPHIALPCSVANHGGDFAWSYCNIIYVFAVICHCYCRPHNYFGSVEDVHQVPMCFPNIC